MDGGTIVDEGPPSRVLTGDLLSRMYQKECMVKAIEGAPMIIPRDVLDRFHDRERRN
jgi:ABC-type cobalamin/Fe3+-siderophores transport system ATPase subunit